MMNLAVGGTHTLLVTPFDADGEYDRESMAALVDFVIDGGVQGVVALGTTGEFFTLSPGERVRVMEDVVAHVRGRVPVTIGVGADSTTTAVDLARHAQSAGADCVMALPPLYFDLTADAQIGHLSAIAQATDVPVMIYDGAGGIRVSADVISAVAEAAENVRYVKLALPEPGRVAELVRKVPDLVPLAGDDTTLVSALRQGARASAIATGCIQPRDIVAIHDAYESEDVGRALKMFASTIAPSVMATSTPKNEFIARFKEVLAAMGVIATPRVRLPLRAVHSADREELFGIMRGLGVL